MPSTWPAPWRKANNCRDGPAQGGAWVMGVGAFLRDLPRPPVVTLATPRQSPAGLTAGGAPPGNAGVPPQPYSSLEVAERRRNVAGRQPPARVYGIGPGRMKGKAPLPFHPCGAVGLRCAGLMCGRDARVPGWASSTQQTGNLICTTPRIGARSRRRGRSRVAVSPSCPCSRRWTSRRRPWPPGRERRSSRGRPAHPG